MRYDNSIKEKPQSGALISIVLSILLSIAITPFAPLCYAFAATEDGESGSSEVIEDEISSLENDGENDTGDGAEDLNEDLSQSEDNDEAVTSFSDSDESPAESFRFSNGQPIYGGDAGYSLRSIGTNYPNTFVRYDEGNHTRSDALCGIDVSYWNGSHAGKPMIDWARVKAAGIDYAIIRSSDGLNTVDSDLKYNVEGCIANNIPFGIYHYARATNSSEASQEAQRVLDLMKNAGVTASNITYPVYYDIENSSSPNYWALGQGVVDTIASTFISRMNQAGYKSGVYSSTSWFKSNGPCGSSYINSLEYRWIAQYNSCGLEYSGFGSGGNALMNNGKGMWQFTSQGYVDGISGYVDLDYSYLGGRYEASGTASVSNIDKDGGTFRVNLSDIRSNRGIYKVDFAVWCESTNGQDDLRWYSGTRRSDGSYYSDISIKDHKGYTGTYIIHGYVSTRAGQSVGSDGSMGCKASIEVNPKDVKPPVVPADGFSVAMEAKGGDYARASAVTYNVTLVSVSDAASLYPQAISQGQTMQFSGSKKDGIWKGSINMHHLRAAGTYTVDTYVTINGKKTKADSDTFTIASYTDPGITMYRMYNRITGEHLYTSNAAERDSLKKGDWNYEGIGWIAASGGTPVYRLYNPALGDHHYTTNSNEKDVLIRYHGWNYEGIGWYTDGSIPVYRQYNSGLRVGQHHYTTNKYEHDVNVARNGWKAEGIGWYALRMK